MDSSQIFNSPVKVKEEPSEVSFTECEDEITEESTDYKIVQLLPFRDNLVLRIPRCDDMMIEFECQDVKPDKNLLLPKKMDLHKIKEEPKEKLKEEVVDDMAEESNSNFDGEVNNDVEIEFECKDVKPSVDILVARKVKKENLIDGAKEMNLNCESVKKNKKRRITKKSDHQNRPKAQSNTVQSDSISAHKSRGKKFAQKSKLKVDSLHNKNTFECNTCKKTFAQIVSLRRHLSRTHNGASHACDRCDKTFKRKDHLKNHIDAIHNGKSKRLKCKKCGKKFRTKNVLCAHIRQVHSEIRLKCDICEKIFACKNYLRDHIVSKHSGIKFSCDTCSQEFSTKSNLKRHVDAQHKKNSHTCGACGQIYKYKISLHNHMRRTHKDVTHQCDTIGQSIA
ncbi:myoneurin-like isoform X1 [Trichogramma pretiosum]|uniref:myoneurin-like isoform X1 n=2 Tax=Trichogramma pretiosum TaxID=7493 RepID=UPI0006C9CF04|nr:myoneurin-like isoform X1 [Trichogramma pretiosum]